MPVPNPVKYAAYAVWAIAALVVLRVILTIALHDDLLDAYAGPDWAFSREMLEDAAPAYTPVALISLVLVAVLAAAAFFLPKAAKWARVVAFVFASLSVLGVVLAVIAPSIGVLYAVNVVVGLLSVAVIVLLAMPESSRFFSSAPARTA